jgi:diadenosine tetraphosphate (Ap4A) HIT family hydrolase
MSDFVNQQNARPGAYTDVINKIADQKVCPFCPDQLANFHKNPIDERTHWLITDNMYPYKPHKNHLMFIHKNHIQHIAEISPEAWAELGEIIREQTAKRDLAGGTFYLRFGDTRFTGASVTHLHANIIQSDPEDPSYDQTKGIMTRVG